MANRRDFIKSITALAAVSSALPLSAIAQDKKHNSSSVRNYVLAHGSWHGGWCWREVAQILRAQGHRVFTPSYTGMGDRAHLISKKISIDTFIEDLVQVINTEELEDVILVGHSFGGIPITGVADQIPDKIGHLVYFDAIVLENGKSAFSNYPKEDANARIEAASKATNGLAVPVPSPLPESWGLTVNTPQYDWVVRRLTPHPLASYTSELKLKNPIGNHRPKTYINCTEPALSVLEDSKALVKSQEQWGWIDLSAPHEAHITHPKELAKILLSFV
ncbi:alpha/beta hydrolase [Oceanisphaera ostreae]|uniref:Alpha/beta fold hydrolase n=1 Tax=Oceanisphaera ostreae TaxID=914151 RepID=A0ABW3KES5_9GAMM